MLNIKKIINNKINIFFEKIGLINNILKIELSNNFIISHYKISGLINIKKKYNFSKKKINFLIKNIIINLSNIQFIKKIYIYKNFFNINIKNNIYEKELKKILINKNLNIYINKYEIKNIVVDYSSPNMCKEMHIGHIRSTILGESFCRISKFLGHNIIKINHIGDYGINYGMIISEIIDSNIEYKKLNIKKIENLYIICKKKYNKDINFKKKSLYFYNQLNIENNKKYLKIWKFIIKKTIDFNNKIYKLLNIELNNNNILGESYYNKKLVPIIIKDLEKKKIAIKRINSIYIPIITKENKFKKKYLFLKKNNINLYIITEIASIKYRSKYMKVDKIVYYIDIRQKNHLDQAFEICKRAEYLNKNTLIEYHLFGMVLDKNKKPFQSRYGNTLKLLELINLYKKKSEIYIKSKNKNLNKKNLKNLINNIAIGTLKYENLSKNRLTNYSINIDKKFDINNNKLIYIQYTYVRIKSIFEKNNIYNIDKKKFYIKNNIYIYNNEELEISILILEYENIIKKSYKDGIYNNLCSYIYKISYLFSIFYKKHRINSNIIIKKKSRLNLILIIYKIIKKTFYLLGINLSNKM